MKLSTLLVTILVTCAIETEAYARANRSIEKRQATNADQMVQNILQWLEGVYAQNSRRIRQGTLREYLPPANTEKPRPFGYPPAGLTPEIPFPFPTNPATGGVTAPGGYEPSEGDNNLVPPHEGSGGGGGQPELPGSSLLPSAGPSTTFPEQPLGSETTPGQPAPGGPTVPTEGGQPELPGSSLLPSAGPSTFFPEQPSGSETTPGQPAPGEPTVPTEGEQPGPAPTAGGTVPESGVSTLVPGYHAESTPGAEVTPAPEGQPAPEGTPAPEQPGSREYTPEQPGSTPEQPQPTPEQPTQPEQPGQPEQPQPTPAQSEPGYTPEQPAQPEQPGQPEQPHPTPEQPEQPGYTPEQSGQPEHTPEQPAQPESTPEQPQPTPEQPGLSESTPGQPQPTPEQPGLTPEQPQATPEQPEPTPEQPDLPSDGSENAGTLGGTTSAPGAPGSTLVPTEGETGVPEAIPASSPAPGEPGIVSTLLPVGTLVPSGFTTSTPSPAAGGEDGATVPPGPEANTIPGPQEPSVVDEEELKHPPHIHALDVQCGKEMMTINIEFNREFNGVIYSKGYFNNPECLYVQENSGQIKYSFTVNLEKCGTQFVTAGEIADQSYLENVLVIQNESGIQEVWDTVRSVRCLWGQNVKDTLSVAFSIGMLSQEIVTFSGDLAMAKLDVVLGRGPFGEPANGLVKIGEEMTLVVSVNGDPTFDLQVKDCKAVDSNNKNSIALTDDDGCILKPKLFGAFQKTRETGNSGASIIAYAHFNAFKFPDEMDLMIECNIELCKNDCDMCTLEGQQVDPAKRRRRRDVTNSTADWITMGKLIKVILPEDLDQNTALEVTSRDHICMTTTSFVFSGAVLVSLLVITSFTCVCLWMKRREKMYLKY